MFFFAENSRTERRSPVGGINRVPWQQEFPWATAWQNGKWQTEHAVGVILVIRTYLKIVNSEPTPGA
jgi:hypothetical protein